MLEAYKQEHGDMYVPKRYKSPDGYKLGQWVGIQRRAEETMGPERHEKLTGLGLFGPA